MGETCQDGSWPTLKFNLDKALVTASGSRLGELDNEVCKKKAPGNLKFLVRIENFLGVPQARKSSI